jgi:hypothetical protein
MRNEVMASVLVAGVLLLLGAGGYVTMSEMTDDVAQNDTIQNVTANVSVTILELNSTNVSEGGNNTLANLSASNDTVSSNTTSVSGNATNRTAVSNATNASSSSPTGDRGGGSGRDRRTITGTNSSGGLLHYGDCLAITIGRACLEDVGADYGEAILAVYNSSSSHVSNVMVAPGDSETALLGNGKAMKIDVSETAINGTEIEAIVYIENSDIDSGPTVSDGRMYVGDCVALDYSTLCLSDIDENSLYEAVFSIYDAQDRFIDTVSAYPGEPVSIAVGDGKAASILVSQTMRSNTTEWAIASIRETNAEFDETLLFYGECMPIAYGYVCLKDVAVSSPHEAIFNVSDILTDEVSNLMVAPGSYGTVDFATSPREVTVYVHSTLINGTLVWATLTTSTATRTPRTVSGMLDFDECLDAGFAKACLADLAVDEPHAAILAVYDSDGNFVSNAMIAPGDSELVSVSDSANARISVDSTTFLPGVNAFKAEVSISRE